MRFVLRHINEYGEWEACKRHLVTNGKLFVERAKASRQKIASIGLPFIQDDDVLLVHSQSRTVTSVLLHAALKHVRFRVFVTESRISNHGKKNASIMREHGIPVCIIPDSAIGFVIDKVDKVFFGAEGVAESGGIINQIGSYQVAVLASNAKKPVYVCAESHKFVRLFPIAPSDVPTEYPFEFTTDDDVALDVSRTPQIDFTPHQYVTALITDLGVLTPSGVSEELIKIWFD
jgi:translation initiation factor eIF-2B subunit alpha